MKIKNEFYLALIIIFAGLLVRLYKINQPILEFFPERQTETAEMTRNIYRNGWVDFWTPKIRYAQGHPTPLVLEFSVYNVIVALMYKLLGANLIYGRLLSILSYCSSSVFFYLILRKYIPMGTARMSLLFFVFSPIHILTSRSFQPDEFALMLLLASIYFDSVIILGLAALVKLPSAIFGLLLAFPNRLKKFDIRTRLLLILLSSIPVIVWSLRASLIMKGDIYGGNYSLANWFNPLSFIDYKWYLSTFQILQINVLSTFGLFLFIIGIFTNLKNAKLKFWFLWLILGAIYAIVFNQHIATHEYYHLLFIPPLSIFVGLGLGEIIGLFKALPKYFRYLATTLVVALFVVGLVIPAISKITYPTKISETLRTRYQQVQDF